MGGVPTLACTLFEVCGFYARAGSEKMDLTVKPIQKGLFFITHPSFCCSSCLLHGSYSPCIAPPPPAAPPVLMKRLSFFAPVHYTTLKSQSWVFLFPSTYLHSPTSVFPMDEGTLKTPIPKCRLYRSFLFGVVKHFCRF
jgi:hypothetical protein